MKPNVSIIAITRFVSEAAGESTDWQWDEGIGVTDAAALTEFAGRSCYESWSKPNPATRENRDYLAHIQEVGHWSVMEHGTVTFRIQGVSRSLTHELIRHRHLSPSQLSQRFVVLNADVSERTTDDFVMPVLFMHDEEAADILLDAWEHAVDAYEKLIQRGESLLGHTEARSAKKRAREAARSVLPNMTPTAIVLTGNHRAWREMLMKRLQPEADREMCRLAVILFELLSAEEPALYQDLEVFYPADGYSPTLRKLSAEPQHPHAGEVVWEHRLDAPPDIDEAESAFQKDVGSMPTNEERPGRVL